MRLKVTKSKNTEHYSIIKDIVKNGKRTTVIYENLGNYEQVKSLAMGEDTTIWLESYIKKLNNEAKNKRLPVILKKYENKHIDINDQQRFNVGYLFLKQIYYNLGINNISDDIKKKYRFQYDINQILETLIYSRIIYPSSKLNTYNLREQYIEKPTFELHQVYRSLEVIAKETDKIQADVYKNSKKYKKRDDKILFYDCTNFFFEIEEEDELRKYGKSKENRPLPIVQMGLFMDGDGLPLAFDITPGNKNEQGTLKPLEEKIIKDFENSKFVVCTDAGLASTANRKFNNKENRAFVTTQSLKKLKKYLKDEAIDLHGEWYIAGDPMKRKIKDLSKLRTDEELINKFKNTTFYKERWINEDGLTQRLIVTYSIKYQEYQKNIRNKQVERANKLIDSNPNKIGKAKQNDYKRFVENTTTTENGEEAAVNNYSLNKNLINEEAQYDGLYAVCTNLEDDVNSIIKINHRRWEIEESFRIMKTEFKSRPVYLSREDRIKAHFTTCFLSLLIFRYLEKELEEENTTSEIINTLKYMDLKLENKDYYTPIYTRTDITDKLHERFGFRTDYEIISNKNIEKIIKNCGKAKTYAFFEKK